jgi:hypothetical protein
MTADNMPGPPGDPTASVPPGDPQAQNAATKTTAEPPVPPVAATPATPAASTVPSEPTAPAAPADTPEAPSPPPFDLAQDMASIIEGQADILAQRLSYHSQIMYGVGAVGVDIVNARNAALVLANALRNRADMQAEQSLVGMGDPQVVQVNDATLPFKNNGQVAGLFEGLVLDTVSRAYTDNPSRMQDARVMLNDIFQPANEEMQGITRLMTNLRSLAPGLPPSR